MKKKYPQLNIGIYRDDGLAYHGRIGDRDLKLLNKDIKKFITEKFDLEATVEPSKGIVNFLDITLNFEDGRYKPYRKPNDRPLYINTKSSHPPNVIKQVPHGINKRLVEISSTENEFKEAKPAYERALKESGYRHKMEYTPPTPQPRREHNRRRKRRIFWYNPPFNAAVITNVGKKFLQLVDKYFPRGSELHPLFNRNTMKLSYSCTGNIKSLIQAHNKKILNAKPQTQTPGVKNCNCQVSVRDQCPLNNDCQQFDVIYEATTMENPPKKYVGSTVDFKKRYGVHKHSFKNQAASQTIV